MSSGQGAFEVLLQLDQRSSQSRHLAEQELLNSGHFQYVRFRVADIHFMAKVVTVSEILPLPPVTEVPFTKPWVIGICNIRGDVIPVSDFSYFLFNRALGRNKKNKLIILKGMGFNTAILVDEILGMSDVVQGDISTDTSHVEQELKSFVSGIVARDGHDFYIMDTKALLSDAGFMKAAV